MALTRNDVALIQMLIADALAKNPPPVARDGVVLGGTWDNKDGTTTAMLADTYAIIGDDGDQYVPQPKIPVASTQLGDQYGPVGNERVVLIQTQGGPVALFLHDEDDSQAVPAGERWIAHRNASGQIDSYLKHTNDGPTPGDGKGGVLHNGGALHTASTTGGHSISQNDTSKQIIAKSAGGHTVTWDDQAKTLTVHSAGGHSVTLDDTAEKLTVHSNGGHSVTLDDVAKTLTSKSILGHLVTLDDQANHILVETKNGLQHLLDDANSQIQHVAGPVTSVLDKAAQSLTHQINSVKHIVDGANNVISSVATSIGVGDLFGSLPSTQAAIVQDHLNTFENNLWSLRRDDLTKFASAMVAAGVPSAGGVMAQLAALVHVSVPSGSSSVRIKS